MSEETWLAEFYPIPADKVSAEDALDHSIKKWEGALKKNLKKHGLGCPPMDFDGHSCALCVHHLDEFCEHCPLSIVRGDVACDELRPYERKAPYAQYIVKGNPRPMLTWLKKAKEMK